MKNKILITTIVLLWTIFTCPYAQQEEPKSFSQEKSMLYSASEFSGIEINNKHGDIILSAWDRDSVKIEIKITTYGESRNSAKKVINQIRIVTSEANHLLNLRTSFRDDFFSNHPVNITYQVSLPAQYKVKLTNRFGNISISSVTGFIDLNMEYGQLQQTGIEMVDSIKGNLSFSEAQIGSVAYSEMDLYNTNIEFQNVEFAILNTQYCQIDIPKAGKLHIKSSTCRFTIGNIKNIDLTGNFCFASLGNIAEAGKIEIDNGLLIINSFSDHFRNLSVYNTNAPINITVPENLNYSLYGEVTNGQFRHHQPEELRIMRETDKISFSRPGNADSNGASIVLFNKNAGINIDSR
jgi:hypothetical protein